MLQPLNTSGKPKAIKIGHTYPHGVSRQYTADMRKIVRHLAKQVKEIILPEIKAQVEQRDGVRNDSLTDILVQIKLLKIRFAISYPWFKSNYSRIESD